MWIGWEIETVASWWKLSIWSVFTAFLRWLACFASPNQQTTATTTTTTTKVEQRRIQSSLFLTLLKTGTIKTIFGKFMTTMGYNEFLFDFYSTYFYFCLFFRMEEKKFGTAPGQPTRRHWFVAITLIIRQFQPGKKLWKQQNKKGIDGEKKEKKKKKSLTCKKWQFSGAQREN